MLEQLREKVRESRDTEFHSIDVLLLLEAQCALWRAQVEALRDMYKLAANVADNILKEKMPGSAM